MRRVYVRLDPAGTRLGNWMFQYAAARSAEPEAEIVFLVERRSEWPDVERRRDLFAGVPIVDAAEPGACVRRGLYQDVKFIDPAVVAEIYRCPPAVEERLAARQGELLRRADRLCSIHVRRGDYLGLPHRHPFVGERYLREAVGSVARRDGVEFAVCSDDLAWCRGFFTAARFPGLVFHFIEGGGVLDDLFLMTKCRHHICSNSTFSWWGAYIGVCAYAARKDAGPRPVTVFPSLWYGPALKGTDWRGLYFPGSEVLPNGYTFGRWCHARAMMAKNRCGDVLRALGLR